MQSFTFIYTVPEADTLSKASHTIKCDCVGYFTKCGAEIVVHSLEFPFLSAFLLVSNYATMVKLLDAAKTYFNNWVNNAKPIAMSEQEVNDILNINNKN